LAYESFEKEALFGMVKSILSASKGLLGKGASKLKMPLTLKAAPVLAKDAGRGAKALHAARTWQRTSTVGKMTQLPSWLLGMGPRHGAHWVGMPLGFGLLGTAFAAPGEHKGKAFLKGVAGGLAFNALMPIGGLVGKGLFRGATAGAGGLTSKAFARSAPAAGGKKVFTTAFGDLGTSGKLLRGGTATAGMVGGLGLGIVGSHSLENKLDPMISTNLGLRNTQVFNPAQLR
jgi:hypothetical protein